MRLRVKTYKYKKIIIIFFSAILLLLGQKSLIESSAQNYDSIRSTEIFHFDYIPDDGSYTISIKDLFGNLEITGHSGLGAELIIYKIFQLGTDPEEKKRMKNSNISVVHLKNKNRLELYSDSAIQYDIRSQNKIELKLPINIAMDVKILGGDINITDIRGESFFNTEAGDVFINKHLGRIDAQTSGGSIIAKRVSGFNRFHCTTGSIDITDSDGQLNASTIGGDISLTNFRGGLEIQTVGGSITIQNIKGNKIYCSTSGGDISGETISSDVKLETKNGDIYIKDILGEAILNTSGGDINVKKHRGPLKCRASFGDLELLNIIGSTDAFTSAGDILLETLYDSSIEDYSFNIETRSGDIGVTIPKGLQVNIESVLHGTKSIKKLNSEIPIKVVSYENKVVGTGKIGGGLIPLVLTTYSGSITINQD